MNFLEIIKKLCEENNISQRKVESDLELSNGSISKWSKSSPSGDVVQRLADYFKISTDYLLGNSEFRNEEEMYSHWEKKHNPNAKLVEEIKKTEESELVYLARKGDKELTEKQKQAVISIMDAMFNEDKV